MNDLKAYLSLKRRKEELERGIADVDSNIARLKRGLEEDIAKLKQEREGIEWNLEQVQTKMNEMEKEAQ